MEESLVHTGLPFGRLYILDCEVQQISPKKASIAEEPIDLQHQRLGHVNRKQLFQQIESSDGLD